MELFNKYKDNLKKVGLSNDAHVSGMIYHTSIVPNVLAFINNNPTILNPLLPFIEPNDSELDELSIIISNKIFVEYFFNSSLIEENITRPVSQSIKFLIEKTENKYQPLSLIENEFNKTTRILKLFESIGNILIENGINAIDDVIKLANSHFNHWKYSQDGSAYTSSIIISNILPTFLADVINTFPFPDKFQSNPNIWLFSKELDNRIKDEKYSLDLKTMQWIWNLHNYIFYINDSQRIELKTKYQSPNGFNEMLSDIFTNINMFSSNLKSKKWFFNSNYKSSKDWNKFIADINNNMEDDYGISTKNEFSSIGEFYSFYSYRFINSILLFISMEKKRKWRLW